MSKAFRNPEDQWSQIDLLLVQLPEMEVLFLIYLKTANGPESLILHTKFHCNWPTSSGEEDFQRVFNLFEHGGHLVHVTKLISMN